MLDGSGGVFLTLLTESYAVRALVGSLAAVGLATLAVSTGMVRSGLARRLLILGPVLTAVAASITAVRANAGFLPSVGWGGSAPSLTFEALQGLTAAGLGVDLLLVLYGTVVGTLVLRRVFGMVTVRRVLARASRPARNSGLMGMTRKLSRKMGIPTPQVLLLRRCPGGAFTVGTLHPIVAVDPQLLRQLDDRELEGLLAHELAHIRRRDNLLWLGVGIARDLSFFLPPMHLAARWLRLEQEESADELASRHTHRPVALASSILKVWDTSRRHRSLSAACAAVGYHRGRMALSMMTPPLPAVASGPAVSHPLPAGQAARAITVRVERLISDGPILTVLRRRVELALALLVLCAASSAAITVPSWIASAFTPQVYVVARPAAQPVEAPAFATFRELAPAVPPSSERSSSTATTSSTANESLGCPCIESQAQLRQGIQATAPQQFSAMQWVRGEQTQRWPVGEPAGAKQSPRQLQQVLGGSSSQIGLFIVTTPTS